MTPSRRDVVATLLLTAALGGVSGPASGAESELGLAPPVPFSHAAVVVRARTLASLPFWARTPPGGDILESMDFDAMNAIQFRPEAELWRGDRAIGAVRFFHLGRYARNPVTIHAVADGQAREILYNRSLFDIPKGNPALTLPTDAGFSGFRVMNPAAPGDWIAYQGASYFRAADPFNQYGLSARGLAIDTAIDGPEEFPVFTAFWLEHGDEGLIVHALLEGPSVAGAYRFTHRRGPNGLVQDVETHLFFRSPVRRLGMAPLTSMFWYGSADRAGAVDWRPQIHDTDGLSIWNGAGERIWRPLVDPSRVMTHPFPDTDPKGFGLMQRDRAFTDYQDDGAFYDRRPSAWVEPVGAWGAGAVQLVELPTVSETEDNVVAFWTPAGAVKAGDHLELAYRLHWTASEPVPAPFARVVATRTGSGGRPGQPPLPGVRKFVVDFEGGRLADLTRESGVSPVISVGDGQVLASAAYPVVGTHLWRLMIDVQLPSTGPIVIKALLRLGSEPLTETWVGQANA